MAAIIVNANDPEGIRRAFGKLGRDAARQYDAEQEAAARVRSENDRQRSREYGEKNEPDEDEPFDAEYQASILRRRDEENARIDSVEVQRGLDRRRAQRVLNTRPGDPELGLSGFDQNLLDLTSQGMTLDEISREINGIMTPAEVHVRVRQIIGARSWLSYMERQAMILLGMQQLTDHVKAVVFGQEGEDGIVYGSAAWADLLRKLFNDIARMVREYQVDAEKVRNELTLEQSRLMIDAIEKSFVVFCRELKSRYPIIDEGEMRDIMTLSLSEAIRDVDRRTGDR